MVEDGRLSAGHARALLTADDPEALAKTIVNQGLNVRQAEALAKAPAAGERAVRAAKTKDGDVLALERDLSRRTGLDVTLEPRAKGGRLIFRYREAQQLEELLKSLRRSVA